MLYRDFEPGEVIMEDEPLLVTREGEKVLRTILVAINIFVSISSGGNIMSIIISCFQVGAIFDRFGSLSQEEQNTLLSLFDPGQYKVTI